MNRRPCSGQARRADNLKEVEGREQVREVGTLRLGREGASF